MISDSAFPLLCAVAGHPGFLIWLSGGEQVMNDHKLGVSRSDNDPLPHAPPT